MNTLTPKEVARLAKMREKKIKRDQEYLYLRMVRDSTSATYCAKYVMDTKKPEQTELERLIEVVCEFDIDVNEISAVSKRMFEYSRKKGKCPKQFEEWFEFMKKLEQDPEVTQFLLKN